MTEEIDADRAKERVRSAASSHGTTIRISSVGLYDEIVQVLRNSWAVARIQERSEHLYRGASSNTRA